MGHYVQSYTKIKIWQYSQLKNQHISSCFSFQYFLVIFTSENQYICTCYGIWLMVFSATFNNISVISWRSVLLVEKSGENHWPVTSYWQTLSHKCCIEYTSPWTGFELIILVVIGTDCTGSCKSNYHTITTMTAPRYDIWKFSLEGVVELSNLCLYLTIMPKNRRFHDLILPTWLSIISLLFSDSRL